MYICIMIELLQHTEALLLENDCVIIPSFGGFVSHYTPARWIEDEGLFLPPTRSIGFNPQLKLNDGLLIQSYMSAYGTDYSDASKLVNKAVLKLIDNLHENGTVEIHGIGQMSLTIHNTFLFEPFEDGLLTPELYGLSSFEMQPIKEQADFEDKKETLLSAPDPKVYEFRVNRSLLRTTITVAAAIILFFFMSTPVENTYIEKTNYAELIPSQLLQLSNSTKNQDTAIKNSDILSEKSTTKEVAKIDIQNSAKHNDVKTLITQKQEISVTTKNTYHIIAASGVTRAGAEMLVKKLKKDGFANASIIENNGRIRVSAMSTSDSNEANQKLNQIQKKDSYKDAWLLSAK